MKPTRDQIIRLLTTGRIESFWIDSIYLCASGDNAGQYNVRVDGDDGMWRRGWGPNPMDACLNAFTNPVISGNIKH